jgi:hypothetical protein
MDEDFRQSLLFCINASAVRIFMADNADVVAAIHHAAAGPAALSLA